MNLNTNILKNLFFLGSTSIGDLSLAVEKSIPITTKGIKDLLKKGYIINLGLTDSTGGRKAYLYKADKNKLGYIISISIERKRTLIDVYNMDIEKVVDTVKIPLLITAENELLEEIVSAVENIKQQFGKSAFLGIGIICPGFVDAEKKINSSHLPDSPLYNVAGILEERTLLPTYIENDSTAIALVEKHFGKAKNSSHTLVINLTWGVGLGILINNKIFKGHKGFAGEFSHIPLADSNKLCRCGKKGCLEVEASLQTAIDYIEERLNAGEASILSTKDGPITYEQLVHAYNVGDQLTIEAIKKIGHMLGKGIATLIHILNPEKIILAGKGIVFGDIILSEVQSSIHLYCIPRLSDQTKLELSELKHDLTVAAASTLIEQIPKISLS
ncbi:MULTISPECIES: ROK family protein [Sphingobacterium]|uniref:ROK family protein n=1 Tax=Sphingobacterium litopenaei TaxID=2763500 RepID=A0ABR7YAM3_9SPHI|nr:MULTISPECIES: ROK family protein [Sphingobacterium]MBD1428357.1 ROK family protein [Sphingobacterium litopenaei]NGM72203.1 ROK family protein [Sphingobacterium sp. SGL-16]